MAARTIVVNVVGDADKLDRTLKHSERELGEFGRKAERSTGGIVAGVKGKLGAGMAVAGAAAGAVAATQLQDAFARGIAMEDELAKIETVFKDSADEIIAFGEAAAENLGIANLEALRAAGNFGNLFTNMGFTTEQAADMSQELLQLVGDLASFNGLPTAEVIEKVNSALAGEFDGLQALGFSLNAAKIETRALKDSNKDHADQLTDTERAAAAYKLVIEGAKNAEGDFKRNINQTSNQLKVQQARFDDLKTEIGQEMIPAVTELARVINDDLAPALKEGTQLSHGWGQAVRQEAEGMVPAVQRAMVGVARAVLSGLGTVVDINAAVWGKIPGPIGDAFEAAKGVFDSLERDVRQTLDAIEKRSRRSGRAAGKGFAEGLDSQVPATRRAAENHARTVNQFMMAMSPTEKGPMSLGGGMEGWGRHAGELFASGLAGAEGDVAGAAGRLAGAAVPAPRGAAHGRSGARSIQVTINASTTASAPEIAEELAWALRVRGVA